MATRKERRELLKQEKEKQSIINKKKELHHRELEIKQDENIKNVQPYEGEAFISLQHINKIYPNHVQAVFDFNLDINEKEFVVFVGPSGCGKSTTLRMIAGLEDITYGNLYIDKEFANTLLPKSRNCAMVFQSYALYPTMSVYDNMAFSLKVRHVDKQTINDKVLEAAKVLELTDYLGRKPSELSGGQRQRVALGRAIVRDAKVFLMDEPLSNLDAKLRVQMRSEIVALHRKIGSTTVYVTHDQTEAMTMADRIVVMKDGYVQQIGTPKEIYNKPANIFVAGFIGAPSMNMVDVKVNKGEVSLSNGLKFKLSKEQAKELEDSYNAEIEDLNSEITALEKENAELSRAGENKTNKLYRTKSFVKRIPNIIELNENRIKEIYERIDLIKTRLKDKEFEAVLGVRPEDLVSEKASKILDHVSSSFELKIMQAELLGNEYYAHSLLDEKKIIAKVSANEEVNTGDDMKFAINLDNIHLFDKDSTKRLF